MNGSICRKNAARIILFNKLLDAHGKRCEMLWAEHQLCAHRTGGRTMDATPVGHRDGRKVCPDVEIQNTPHILTSKAFVTALSPSVPTSGPFLSILTAKNQIYQGAACFVKNNGWVEEKDSVGSVPPLMSSSVRAAGICSACPSSWPESPGAGEPRHSWKLPTGCCALPMAEGHTENSEDELNARDSV